MSRVLIIRLSAIGDVAMASGLIPALRRAHPRAYLAWLCEPAAADLLRYNPALDELIAWPKSDWLKLWRARRLGELAGALRGLRAELRERRFDIALDAQGILKSAALAVLSGARERIGLRPREGSRLLYHRALQPPEDDPRLGSEYRFMAEALGLLPAADYRMDVALGESARRSVADKLAAAGVRGDYAALCPFTTRPQKHWFERRWAELAARLAAAGLTPVLLGGGAVASAAAERIASCSPARHLVGATSLAEAAAAIAGSALVVGVDTGLTHLGPAFERPTLALFGSTRPYLRAGGRSEVLYHDLACAPCRRRPSCNGRFDCMRAHHADEVAAAAFGLLGRTR